MNGEYRGVLRKCAFWFKQSCMSYYSQLVPWAVYNYLCGKEQTLS